MEDHQALPWTGEMTQTDRSRNENKTGRKLNFEELLLAQFKNKKLHLLCSFADMISRAVR